MGKGRLEAFSDGVIAIIITIMVLELKAPEDDAGLLALLPVFLSYILSFVYVGIYWNNHHHLLQISERVSGSVLWANLHLLFWLSLIPFVTAWIGNSHFGAHAVAAYGALLLLCAGAYNLLESRLGRLHGPHSKLGRALLHNQKEKLSVLLYAAAIALAFVNPLVACLLYAGVAVMWFVPDRRFEAALAATSGQVDQSETKQH